MFVSDLLSIKDARCLLGQKKLVYDTIPETELDAIRFVIAIGKASPRDRLV